MDDEGENLAVRVFLMQYGTPGLTVGAMSRHMSRCGYPLWPAWVNGDAWDGGHLTKAGAQLWLRHLFSLEPQHG
jgi:lysophospholipase L1-like esterase